MRRILRGCAPGLVALFVFVTPSIPARAIDPLLAGFVNPPEAAKPRVWWHWMNGDITVEGIELDVQWMRRIGIGGLQNFDVAALTPPVVDRQLLFMTPPWNSAFRQAVTLCDRMGLEFAIAGSPGWSESGGPWVHPEQGMKKLVWSETRVSDAEPFSGKLQPPPTTVGPFQNVPVNWGNPLRGGPPLEPVPSSYTDVAVIGYRVPDEDRSVVELKPVVTSSAGAIDANRLWDGDFTSMVSLPVAAKGKSAWIEFDFGHPITVQSMTLALAGRKSFVVGRLGQVARLDSSSDGKDFHSVATADDTIDVQQTVTFAPAKGRYFRLVFLPPADVPPIVAALNGPPPKEHVISEFVLHTTARVDHFEQKAGFFSTVFDVDNSLDRLATPHTDSRSVVSPSDVLDLTSHLRSDGTLDWKVPPGRWEILRMGYSLLGTTNHPTSAEATGLEVDKLSRASVRSYMDGYLSRYAAILGSRLMGKHGLHALVNDSWEAGAQNWTEDLPGEFIRRRHYDLRSWLPALTGHIIGTSEATEKFLWDFRRTLGELLTENHYEQIAQSVHERGMIQYGESHESGRAFIGDGMDAKRATDIPMGAMWAGDFFPQEKYDADLRESASVAHIYGQNLVAAESLTAVGLPGSAFAFSPETLKPTVDRELADGVNLFVLHSSVHQPLVSRAPGVTLGFVGQWFTRNETWAEEAGPWITYLARSAYLMQQGHFVADVLYYYGQDSNITALYADHLPSIPEGYAFDFASAHALTRLSVRDRMLEAVSGTKYRVLVLDPRATVMSADVLRQIGQLVAAGATVVGDKPIATPSLVDDADEFKGLADAVWGTGGEGIRSYGRGCVISQTPLDQAFSALGLEPDFSYAKPTVDSTVWFAHRQLQDGDVYFITNRQDRAARIDARFRVSGKVPEIWHAQSGKTEPLSFRTDGHRTFVTLDLSPHDAFFVVFRRKLRPHEPEVSQPKREEMAALSGPWLVQFQSGRGAPEHTTFAKLESWSSSPDAGIKYFSGTASYELNFNVPASWLEKPQHLELELGAVKNIAEVFVNGKSAGVAWTPPFRVDVTRLLHPGANHLKVNITNLWPNRLIGDKQPEAAPVAFTTANPYSADSPLFESGLLGPVSISRVFTADSR